MAAGDYSRPQSILGRAFRGELVPQDSRDEPASLLLERIRAEREAAAEKKAAKKPTKKTGRATLKQRRRRHAETE